MGEKAKKGTSSDGQGDFCDILDALPFYVMLVDENHHIVYANSAVLKQLKMDPKEIAGKYCPKVVHGVDDVYFGCPLEEAAAKNEGVEKEVFDPATKRWVISSAYPTNQFTAEGKRIFFHMITDVTKKKAAEEALKVSHKRLRELSSYLSVVEEEERKKIARELHD